MAQLNVSAGWAAGSVVTLLLVGILSASLTSAPSIAHDGGRSAAAAGKDVVLVRCKTAGETFRVSEFQGSVSTPARKTDNCADTLGDLLKAGFALSATGTSQDADLVVYTLTR